jgi:hypothetical protein
MEREFPVPETREATRNAAITASTLMNRNLRIQHAMTEEMSVMINGGSLRGRRCMPEEHAGDIFVRNLPCPS